MSETPRKAFLRYSKISIPAIRRWKRYSKANGVIILQDHCDYRLDDYAASLPDLTDVLRVFRNAQSIDYDKP
ncbi:hypothetical protein RLEG12_01595 (plasmid) [Rhizobium leguminosarum bv. trifolii CB782]|nr:hypothetical protein RLEG12_01595 [Rhizobium leguminosarum bv. trifolii CB782]